MNQYLVDGLWVDAESHRYAAKYYKAVLQREPDYVSREDNGAHVVGWCENTGLAIFDNDQLGRVYDQDAEGIMWLKESK